MQDSAPAVLGYAPLHPCSIMETPGEELADLQPASPTILAVNALSQTSIDLLWDSMTTGSKPRLRKVVVTTGGRPPLDAWASTWKAGDKLSVNKGSDCLQQFPNYCSRTDDCVRETPCKAEPESSGMAQTA